MSFSFGQRGSVPQMPRSTATGGETINIQYVERPGLLRLSLKNALFNILTLGFYRFWAKTNTRRHVWSCISINGDFLEYTGTGKELFLGFLVVFGIIFLPFIILVGWLQASGNEEIAVIVQMVFAALMMVFYGMAIYRARRYRLSRTVWRGIRGSLTGSSWSYSLLYLGKLFLGAITFGWSNPAMSLKLQDRITSEMKFGETPFLFSGSSSPLYTRYAACWFGTLIAIIVFIAIFASSGLASGEIFQGDLKDLENAEGSQVALLVAIIYGGLFLVIVTYGVIWAFYSAFEMAQFASYTRFETASFRLNSTAPSLIWLWLGNILLIILTFGIATPYTVQRIFRYMCDRLEVDGWVDIAAIQQSTAPIDKRGEGLLDAFDLDGI